MQTQRRAVLIVDVVESARLLRADAAGYVSKWRLLLQQAREHLVRAHDGRFVKSLGDGMLVHFAGVDAAVACALALHDAAAALPGGPADAPLRLRAGVTLADLVEDDIDVYGDGVNLAARLTALALPGDVVVSEEARGQLVHGVSLHIADMGYRYVKHYADAVRPFCVRRAGATALAPLGPPADLRVTVAVCPFMGLDTEPGTRLLGMALADDLIAALTRRPSLRVIARASTQALLAAGAPEPAQSARHLGAAYVLGGSLHTRGARARVRASLCDTTQGEVLWADALELEVGALFQGDDHCVPRIVSQVCRAVLEREVGRARALPVSSLSSYSLMTAGIELLHRLRRAEFERAHQVLSQLAELEPRSPAPQALLAKWQLLRVAQGWADDGARAAAEAADHVHRALDLQPDDGLALSLRAHLQAQAGHDLDAALATALGAVEAAPQEPNAWLIASGVHGYRGDGAAAVAHAEGAIRLSPLDPARFLFDAFLANALLVDDRPAEALAAAEAAVSGNSQHPASLRLLAASAQLAGQPARAHEAGRALLQLVPGFSVDAFARRHPGGHHPCAARQVAALREAGLPA